MYADHVPIINAAARAKPAIFARTVLFAALSARQPFNTVRHQLRDVTRVGERSTYLFAWKLDTYRYLQDHGDTVWSEVCATTNAEAAIWAVTRVPGMGVVKGAFVCQMLGHDVACLDTRNIKREGLNPRAYRHMDKNSNAWRRSIARYVGETGGRAAELWDAWCTDVAATYRMTPDECSAEHLAIVPKRDCRYAPLPVFNDEIPF